jgi:uncharacterized repeat protein (TIGR03843 family)
VNALVAGDVELVGRMPWSSNHTFLVTCTLHGEETAAVYKPQAGERHLWDFPPGIYKREIAAYALSELLGWGLVPETVERVDAPMGPGSLQRFVAADFSEHHFTLVEVEEHHDRLRRICAFDILANNADRKSGHCLLDRDGHIWAIDNALSFHVEPKLRTVIWDFAGEPVPARLLADIERLADGVPEGLAGLLDDGEPEALVRRARAVLRRPELPAPHPERRPYPWPLV